MLEREMLKRKFLSNGNMIQIREIAVCRSIVLPRFGGPEVLEVHHDTPVPELKSSEVLVRTVAAAINPLDLKMRGGYGRSLFEPLLPLVLGRDVSGEVAAVGSAVKRLCIGQAVFGAVHPTAIRGTYSEYSVLAEEQLAEKPTSLTHVQAAAIPFAALTAWRALQSTAQIKSGQRILVMGSGGAVGFAAIQLARAVGCEVTCTCGKRSIDRVMAAGAKRAVDYASENLKSDLKGQYDVVLDTIGLKETEAVGIDLLKRGGYYMTLQGEAVTLADRYGLFIGGAMALGRLLRKQLDYRQSHGIEYSWTFMRTDIEGLEEITRLANLGKLEIPVGQSYPLEAASEAHRARESKQVHGKVVLEVC